MLGRTPLVGLVALRQTLRVMVVSEIHIHEDEWGMRVLYPFEAHAAAEADIAEARRWRGKPGSEWVRLD